MKLASWSCGSLRQQLHYTLSALPVLVLSSSWGVAPGCYISRLWRSKIIVRGMLSQVCYCQLVGGSDFVRTMPSITSSLSNKILTCFSFRRRKTSFFESRWEDKRLKKKIVAVVAFVFICFGSV